jgi:hypothetical protein
MTLDLGKLVPAAQMYGEDEAETTELREMLTRARSYLLSHRWCESVTEEHLGFGVGGIVAVFLVRARLRTGGEELLWVVDGDLPPAYLVTDRAKDAATALEVYADLMQDWVNAVRQGKDLREVFPVEAPPDEEHAALLETRIRLLRSDMVPAARERAEES